jgi:small nuclear ribonucleoprotein (snRNP)-like protein
MIATTAAPFALVLEFYERFRYMKLQNEDLGKMFSKYNKHPEKILADLRKKYNLAVPTAISIDRVKRLLAVYDVPERYATAMWSQIAASVAPHQSDDAKTKSAASRESYSTNSDVYDAALDINSSSFDAEAALHAGRIIAPDTTVPALDNLSKFKHLLEYGVDYVQRVPDRTLIDQAKAIVSKLKKSHLFDNIAGNSQRDRRKRGETAEDEEEAAASPLALLEKLMTSRNRAHIVIRRRGGVKGIVLGYIQAFDRHLNILVSDADETFVQNKKKVGTRTLFVGMCV